MKLPWLSRIRFMRDHRWTLGHLSEYLDRELDVDERARIEQHAGLCPDCHRLLATLRRTLTGLRQIGTEPTPAGVTDAVLDRLRRER